MWKTFCAHTQAYSAAHPDEHDVIIGSAIETFSKFGLWVTRRKSELSKANDGHVA
jgi:hypothetical protein